MPYADLPAFMTELRVLVGTAPRVLEFTILTAARSGEATGARWSEINLAERVWVVPPERMKAGREHRVPLSDAAIAILSAQGNESEFVFPGAWKSSQPISQNTLFYLLRRMGRAVSVHGFRSAFMDWATECTTFTAEMRDLALAHVVSDRVEAAYRRGDMFDRRRELMDAWASFCDGEAAEGANVVPLRARS
jgi:integrase